MQNINQFRKRLVNEQTRANDLQSIKGDISVVPGRVMINNAGEAYIDINFPVRFVDLPNFTSGFETQEGQGIIEGQMPTGTAHVSAWKTIERLPVSVFYTGAKIQVVTTGQFYQKMILNFSFTGTAITNPSL